MWEPQDYKVGFWSLDSFSQSFSILLEIFQSKILEVGLGRSTYHFFLRASISEGQRIQFYYIFGELSPGISLKKKV